MRHGLHHVTAIAGEPRRNLAFYTGTLGLRLVKKTVNFDDPGTYHFYFGDATGSPGSIVTFFPWTQAAAGQNGVGQASETAFRVPESSLGHWAHRLVERGVAHGSIEKRFGQSVLPFQDADGMRVALVGVPGAASEPAWAGADLDAQHALRGLHGVTLLVEDPGPTAAILTDVLGFRETAREGLTMRFVADAPLGAVLDLQQAQGFLPGRLGRGSVHHIAFRAGDDADQAAKATRLLENHGLRTTEQKDRNYFRSVYFREPNGVLFEIATDGPGFAADEAADALGRALKLPPFLEPRRREIEAVLPEVG
jgi:glyoxalase family protein